MATMHLLHLAHRSTLIRLPLNPRVKAQNCPTFFPLEPTLVRKYVLVVVRANFSGLLLLVLLILMEASMRFRLLRYPLFWSVWFRERQRERARESARPRMYVYICMHLCVCACVCVERERQSERERARERGREERREREREGERDSHVTLGPRHLL